MAASPEKWETVKALFGAALELDSSERSAFLRENCPDDEARAEVERLLNEHDQAGTFLSTPMLGNFSVEAEAPTQELSESQLLAGRFRILRFVAGGGMGEVYEAEDQELRERVAIKTIRPEILAQPNAMARFKREVHLARKVTHPNVCRIFDLFRDRPNGGSVQKETVFISMELLRGETLAARLKEGGRMSVGEALPLVRQMASALAAAHAVGIVHRDFKPGNVMLVVVPGHQAERAVVTDFGLALQSIVSDEDASISTGQGLLGTPAYMSPEQIEGRPATTASDIYALGLVIYEMVTGARPFQGDTPLSAAVKRLSEAPPTPRSFEPGLSLVWESAILRCLARDPSLRFPNAEAVAEALASEEPTLFRIAAWNAVKRQKTATSAAVLLIVVLIGGGLYYRAYRSKHLNEKDTIVIADFANSTGDPVFDDTLKTALSVALRQSPFLSLLSDDRVGATLKLMTRPPNTTLTPDVAREVCQRSHSKAYIAGSIATLGNEYVLGLNEVNCQDGDSLDQEQAEVTRREEVIGKLREAATAMREKLGESLASIQKYDTPLEQATTSSLEALQAYSKAVRARYSTGDMAAVPLLRRAIDLDPNFALAYADLGAAYSNLGQGALSIEAAQKAYNLRQRATEREKFYIDSSYYGIATGELDKEIQVYQQWKQTYTRDQIPYQNSALNYGFIGQYDKAAAGFRDALRLEPNDVNNYINLAATYINLNQLDKAAAILDQAHARQLEHEALPLLYYILAFLRDDAKEMERWATAASGGPGIEDMLFSSESDTEAFHGRLRNARNFSHQAVDSAIRNGAKETAAGWQAHTALFEAELGDRLQARREALDALTLSPTKDVQSTAALALARAGDAVRAQTIVERLRKGFPADTLLNGYWLPSIRSAIAINHNNPQNAIEDLQIAEPYELGGYPLAQDTSYPVYLRGLALLMGKQASAAAGEFQKILAHPGRLGNSPLLALAHLQLARAYAASGDKAKAQAEYEDFFTHWKDADADLPLLRQAKMEFLTLK